MQFTHTAAWEAGTVGKQSRKADQGEARLCSLGIADATSRASSERARPRDPHDLAHATPPTRNRLRLRR
jgi:hypothetical protein